ncbi:hypothetical protein PIB30_020122 [Stylosanthes scabra]|uniref:GRF-type domain-containing protein n=1 Tax=Stylosanthes scabra TaxID=79078 RepID=A0ABU6X8K3_9FABA|nr:hypothetical protein [Stylosanthes scabra]
MSHSFDGSSSSTQMKWRRHRCYCGALVMVYAASNAASTGRRYVACGKVPKCGFFQWINDEEDGKSGCKSKEKMVQCFCGDALILQMSGTALNPNRRFISCPNRSCKYFEWIDEEGNACSNGGNCRSQRMDADGEKIEHYVVLMEAQERKIERLHMEIGRINSGFERACDELVLIKEKVGRLENNISRRMFSSIVTMIFIVGLVVVLFLGRLAM